MSNIGVLFMLIASYITIVVSTDDQIWPWQCSYTFSIGAVLAVTILKGRSNGMD